MAREQDGGALRHHARKEYARSIRLSLIEPCKLNGADPQAYFADVLTQLINLWPASLLDQLMPWVWAAEHSNKTLAA